MPFASSNFPGTAGTELSVADSNWSKVSGIVVNALVDGSGGAYDGSGGNTNFYQHSATPPSADYSVSCTVPGLGASTYTAGPALRIVGQTFYTGFYHGGIPGWVIQRYDDINTSTYIANAGNTTNSPTVSRVLKIEAIGSAIKLYSDGVLVASATDATYSAAGKAGCSFDDPSTHAVHSWSADGFGPTISVQPASANAYAGTTATFSVTASGSGTLHYQWKKNGTNVGTDSSSYTTPTLTTSDTGPYRCDVTDSAGTTSSNNATLTFPVPAITVQPTPQTVADGATATFSVTATSLGTPTYQWQVNPASGGGWTNVSTGTGGTTNSYTTAALSRTTDYGNLYRCVVTDSNGSVNTNEVALVVTGYATSYEYTPFYVGDTQGSLGMGQTEKLTTLNRGLKKRFDKTTPH